MRTLSALPLGIFFGIVLVKSEVSSWYRIQAMFRFEEAHMYLIMGSAVAVGAISILLIKALHLGDVSGQPAALKGKPFTWGIVIGGSVFGMGWAVTGACPGPVYAQIGSGEVMALLTFVGVVVGVLLYAWLRPRLPH